MNHTPNCAFAVSHGDEGCDCDGPTTCCDAGEAPVATAKRYLAEARAALAAARPKRSTDRRTT